MTGNIPKKVFIIATEESGDRLGGSLIQALKDRLGSHFIFAGVGGEAMSRQGIQSLFPIEELAIVGLTAVVKRLPSILQLIGRTVAAVLAFQPDMLIVIDSPDFNLRVARRVRAADPKILIVDYVSPTVWAWRPGRARAMRGYVDHVLALLPFEPESHRQLEGPPCTYVGHPLIEKFSQLRPSADEGTWRKQNTPVLLVMPGSRRSEIRHHMPIFGEALRLLHQQGARFEAVLPTLPHLRSMIADAVSHWPTNPRIVDLEEEKYAAFRIARAALTKSGTSTLELAIAGVPMVAAYRGGTIEAWIILRLIRVSSVILANLVIGEKVVPEFIQDACTPENLARAVNDILSDTRERRLQIESFARLDAIMADDPRPPSTRAADVVTRVLMGESIA